MIQEKPPLSALHEPAVFEICEYLNGKDSLNFLQAWFASRGWDNPKKTAEYYSSYWYHVMRTRITCAPLDHFRGNPAKVVCRYLAKYYGEPNPFDISFSSEKPHIGTSIERIRKAMNHGHEVAAFHLIKPLKLHHSQASFLLLGLLEKGFDDAALEMFRKLPESDTDFKKYLDEAIRKGCMDVVREIAKIKPELLHSTPIRPPLHLAARHDNIAIMKFLIAAGVNVNGKSPHHWTPLHIASEYGNVDAISLLIAAGANLEATDNEGLTPYELACKNGKEEIIALLAPRGTKRKREEATVKL